MFINKFNDDYIYIYIYVVTIFYEKYTLLDYTSIFYQYHFMFKISLSF